MFHSDEEREAVYAGVSRWDDRPEDENEDRPVVRAAAVETPDPLDHALWTLGREAEALIVGLSVGAFHPTRAQRTALVGLIDTLQRCESLAIDVGV